ncbi:MAG TPA: DMT family transporter [Sporosarcina psychrophila]|uniref:DMT family transporter n=1 Tax=Sporosarcina psychrophila TaxID=1476 RepID=A0A921FWC5_SPOPS|nr:DMT family transporter [Sporosarcina psychrophila]
MEKIGLNRHMISNSDSKKQQLRGILIVLFASALFSSLGTLTNIAYEAGVSPIAFGAWREIFGAITMCILLILGVGRQRNQKKVLATIPGWQWRNLAIAAFAFMSYSLAIFYAFVHLTVALAFLLFYIYPAIVTVISAITGHEMLNKQKIIALLFALAGSSLAVVGQMFGQDMRFDWLGIGLALFAAVGMSVYFLVGRNGYPSVPASYATTIFLIAAGTVFATIGFAFGEKEAILQPFQDASLWPILIFAGVFAAALPTMLLLTGIRMIGASKASILAIFEPVMGSVLAAIVLGQSLYFIQIVGGILILSAAFILQRNSDPQDIKSTLDSQVIRSPLEESTDLAN